MSIDLSGKTALITGASRGIGEAAARVMAGYGANVVLAARSTVLTSTASRPKSARKAMAVNATSAAIRTFRCRCRGCDEPFRQPRHSGQQCRRDRSDRQARGLRPGYLEPGCRYQSQGRLSRPARGDTGDETAGWRRHHQHLLGRGHRRNRRLEPYCATKAAVLSLTRCVHKENAKTTSVWSACRPAPWPPTCSGDQGLRRQSGQPARLVEPHLARMGRRRQSPGWPPTPAAL
jgi:3-oxoacyl-[acyl-carrier protein] reductase